MWRPWIWGVALAGLLAAPSYARSLPQHAYIWQRLWTPPVVQAVTDQADLVSGWRVLAAQSDRGGPLTVFSPDLASLTASGRPVVAVIRIDGPQSQWDQGGLVGEITALVQRWRNQLPSLAGVEVDHDSATARLPDYARFLAALRQSLTARGVSVRLSVTALPTWMGSPHLDDVIAQTDDVVIQVHGTRPAPHTIFDAEQARRWVTDFARRTQKPFLVALPTYGVRALRDGNGSVMAVEAESPTLAGGTDSVPLWVSPVSVAALMADWAANPPPHLAGLVWFRLPTAQDSQGWSQATFRAVVLGHPLSQKVVPAIAPGDRPGLTRLFLTNQGTVDAAVPLRVTLPPHCRLSDGINGYRLDDTALTRPFPITIHPGQRLEIGWTRCSIQAEDIHVSVQ